MTIAFVGSGVGTHALTSTSTYNFSSLLNSAGGTPTLLENDLVIVSVINATTVNRGAGTLVPSGYTAFHTATYADDTNDTNQQVSYKFMGSSPDTSVAIPASNATTAGVAWTVHVFRNVDKIDVVDVTTSTVTGTNGAQPNPPAVLPNTAGAWIYESSGGAMAAGAAYQSTAPTGMSTTTNAWRQTVITTTTNDAGIASGYKSDWSSGSYDCAALTGGTSTNTGSWSSVAIVLKPQILTLTATQQTYTETGPTGNRLVYGRKIVAPVAKYTPYNYVLYSEAFSNAWWTKTGGTVTDNFYKGPLASTINATKFTEDTGNTMHGVSHTWSAGELPDGKVTLSFFVLLLARTWIYLEIICNGVTYYAYIDPTGSFGASSGASPAAYTPFADRTDPNGWARVSITTTSVLPCSTNAVAATIAVASADTVNTFTGSGVATMEMFGAQVEVNVPYVSPYVSTSGAAAFGANPWSRVLRGYSTGLNTTRTYTLTGIAATLTYASGAKTLSAATQSYTITGPAGNRVLRGYPMLARPRSYGATNYFTNSQNFGITYWTTSVGNSVTDAFYRSPEGYNSQASKITEDTSTGNHFIGRSVTFPTYTTNTDGRRKIIFSVYAKALGTRNWLSMQISFGAIISFNLSTGAIGTPSGAQYSSAYTESAGDGWYRCVLILDTVLTSDIDEPPSPWDCYLIMSDADGSFSYTGTSQAIALWGAQVETSYELTSASSYVPTSGTAPLSKIGQWAYLRTGKNMPTTVQTYAESGPAGNRVLYNRISPATTRTYALTGPAGNNVLRGYPMTAATRTYTLTGPAGNRVLYNRIAPATTQTYALTGPAGNRVLYGRKITNPVQTYILTAPTGNRILRGYPLVAATRTYIYSPQTSNLLFGHKLAVDSKSYVATAPPVNLPRTYKIINPVQTYALTGPAGNRVLRGYPLVAAARTYTLTGPAGNRVLYGYRVTNPVQTYVLTGPAGNKVLRGYPLVGATRTYSLTSIATGLTRTYRIINPVQTYALTGPAGNRVLRGYPLTATTQTYTLTGPAGNRVLYGRLFPETTQTYVLAGPTGNRALRGYPLVAATRAYTLSGVTAGLDEGYRLSATAQTYTLTSISTGVYRGYPLAATTQAYALTSIDTSLVYTHQTNYVLSVDVQTYVLSGVTAGLDEGHKLTATTQTYALSGPAGNRVLYNIKPSASTASYALTGIAAGVLRGYPLAATTRTYTVTGIATGVFEGHKTVAATQTYTLTTIATPLPRTYRLPGTSGTYSVSQPTTGLYKGYRTTVATQAYTLTGIAAGAYRGYPLAAIARSYALTGIAANLLEGHVVQGTTRAYTLTAPSANLIVPGKINVDKQSYTLTSIATNLLVGHKMSVSTATFTSIVPTAGVYRGYPLVAATRAYTLTAVATGIKTAHVVPAATQTYVLGLQAAGLIHTYRQAAAVTAYQASFTTTGLSRTWQALQVTPYQLTFGSTGLIRSFQGAEPGDYQLTFGSTAFTRTYLQPASTTPYLLSTAATGVYATRFMQPAVAPYALSFNDAVLDSALGFAGTTASFLLSAGTISFTKISLLTTTAVSYVASFGTARLTLIIPGKTYAQPRRITYSREVPRLAEVKGYSRRVTARPGDPRTTFVK
jgi:sorbitol-specific phosphotransferase system component IIC